MQLFVYNQVGTKRLDTYLLEKFSVLSVGKLNKYLRENKIKLNGKKMPLDTKLQGNDEIKIFIPDDKLGLVQYKYTFLAAGDNLCVVFEDEDILAIDKAAGVPVQSIDTKNADTLIARCHKYLYNKNEYNPKQGFTPCLCHRIDTGTSGIVLVAKTQKAYDFVLKLFENKSLCKEYLCVTFNHPQPKKFVLKGYHIKNEKLGLVTISETIQSKYAKPVETRYETMATSGVLALLKVQLITGRTHQIRAHLESIGCPILGDSKYGNNTENRKRKMKYQALCSWKITFPHIKEYEFLKYSKLVLETEKPWYCDQIINKILK